MSFTGYSAQYDRITCRQEMGDGYGNCDKIINVPKITWQKREYKKMNLCLSKFDDFDIHIHDIEIERFKDKPAEKIKLENGEYFLMSEQKIGLITFKYFSVTQHESHSPTLSEEGKNCEKGSFNTTDKTEGEKA